MLFQLCRLLSDRKTTVGSWVLLLISFYTLTLPAPQPPTFSFISEKEMGTRQVPLQALAHVILHIQYMPLHFVASHQPGGLRTLQNFRGRHTDRPQKLRDSRDWYLHVMSFPVLQLFVGLGFPYEGPAPLEAIANGCAFLNPKFNPPKSSKNTDFFIGKPTLREVGISFMLLCLCLYGQHCVVCMWACMKECTHV